MELFFYKEEFQIGLQVPFFPGLVCPHFLTDYGEN